MSQDTRLRQLERNYELLRAEILNMKRLAQDWKGAAAHLESLKEAELRTLQREVETLRRENTQLREVVADQVEVTPALSSPWTGKEEPKHGG